MTEGTPKLQIEIADSANAPINRGILGTPSRQADGNQKYLAAPARSRRGQ